MIEREPERHSERACCELFSRFLLKPAELLQELAPEGWDRSPLHRAFHPTVEQWNAERKAFQRNLDSLRSKARRSSAAFQQGEEETPPGRPTEPETEVVELLGLALWDIFSNNHAVSDQRGTEYDLGSFRASAAFIAGEIDKRYPQLRNHDYMDFYMGTLGIAHRADLTSLYRWVFTRLREVACDWTYVFPRLHLISFDDFAESTDPLAYDPSESVRAELEAAARRKETAALGEELDRFHDDAVERARHAKPPAIVNAYQKVFGRFPRGWPPSFSG